MNSVPFIILRRMRAPLIVVIVIFAVSIVGLTLIPGVDAEGNPAPPLTFFHAFYFISYTATTIGFGELPNPFSNGQRLWVIMSIFLTVIGWSYALVTLLSLIQDKGFQNTIRSNRFARRVRALREPFHLIAGCGETGGLVGHALDRLDRRFVVLEQDPLRVQELDLEDFKTDTPALAADARLPANLLLAGLRHPSCAGVLALTNNERANLAVAVAARLLNPDVPVLARARTAPVMADMASFGTDHIINPYRRFAEYLALAVAAPEQFRLHEILTGLPGAPWPEPHVPPRGHWIVCGYGTFGRAVTEQLRAAGIELTVVDPEAGAAAGAVATGAAAEPAGDGASATGPAAPASAPPADAATSGPLPAFREVRGTGSDAAVLRAAGIDNATGIVAGTDNDVANLAIAVTAQDLHPGIFVVTRQNLAANGSLFEALVGDFSMVPSRIVAQECLAVLTTPLMARLLARLRDQDEIWSGEVSRHLAEISPDHIPDFFGVRLTPAAGAAAHAALSTGRRITIGGLVRDSADRDSALPAVPLLLVRGDEVIDLPEADVELEAGDQLLFAAPEGIRRSLDLTVQNANVLEYVLTGRESGGWLWDRLFPAGVGAGSSGAGSSGAGSSGARTRR